MCLLLSDYAFMKKYFSSRIFQKALAALTGGFLVLFLIGHLAGNLQLFIPGELGQKQFNAYALFMTTNPAVIALSYVTYTSIFLHLVFTLYLTLQSRKARPVKYLAKAGQQIVLGHQGIWLFWALCYYYF